MNRETWLNQLAEKMAPRFADLGHPLPPFRVSVGFTSGGMTSNAIGECWSETLSDDKHFEIFLTPLVADSMAVAACLAHELTHAAVGLNEGHKGAFASVALAIGLKRPMTATTADTAFVEWMTPHIDALGPIPHAAINYRQPGARGRQGITVDRGKGGVVGHAPSATGGAESSRPPKQSTRLKKAGCTECGYNVRVTGKWLEIGPPHCPTHGAMTVAEGDAGE